MSAATSPDLIAELERVFGYSAFRPHQEEAVHAALEGRDCLVVMPTGAGKSLTFQLPAALDEGVTVVISPLIALMRDQIIGLRERTAFAEMGAAYLNSSQDADEQRDILTLLRADKLKLLYIAPERLRSQGFVDTLKESKVARLVVDEAHCISEWGHDFRPDYLAVGGFLQELGRPPVMAVTATATTRVQESVAANLTMRDPEIIVGGFNRPNLHFSVVKCKNDYERSEKLAKALPKLFAKGGSGLIYVSTRKQCEAVAETAARALAPLGIHVGSYHAGMDNSIRSEMQNAWLNNHIPLLVATNAFGMGIDKPDVRFVIHWGYPESPESYYQEAGRAGRDGKRSRAVILTSGAADRKLREFFIENEALTSQDLSDCVRKLSRLCGDEATRVPRYWFDAELGWREPKPRVVLGKLERAGLIERSNETPDGAMIRVVERNPGDKLRTLGRALEREKAERMARLEEMVSYVKSRSCRRKVLLDYFGDPDIVEQGNCCDVCDARANGSDLLETVAPELAQGRVDVPNRIDDIYDLLQGLDALWPQVGKTRLGKILRGSNGADVQRYTSSPIFGACAGVSVARLNEWLDELIQRGMLHQGDEDEYYVVRVTRAGREAWQMRAGTAIEIPGKTRATRSSNTVRASRGMRESDGDDFFDEEEGGALFERLRVWRRQRASEENLPPYCVFGDKVLREIARQKPETEDELSGISGVGAAKLEKYGALVLEVVNE